MLGERYLLERRLARGGTGEVWCGHDRLLDRPIAAKLPRPGAGDPDFGRRLLAEARHAAAVQHPGIAEVYDVAGDGPVPYLIMELVDGRPLARVVAEEAPVAHDRARRLLCQIAAALDAAHAAGLVHRDVKPANLLVTADDTVKVTDFGISRAVDAATVTRTGFVVGTAQYLSPEQAGGRPASPESDMYALGVVGYELLTGRRPFDGEPLETLRAHRESPVPALPHDVPPDLAGLVLSLLAKDPAQRPTAAEVVGRAPAPPRAASRPVAAAPDDAGPATAPHALPRHAGTAGPRRLVLAGAAAVSTVGLLLAMALTGGGEQGGGSVAAEAAAPEPQPVPVRAASLFHPGGSDDDHADEVPLAVDGDPSTAWTTQTYGSPQFGNLRPGVGLLFDLGQTREVRSVHLTVASPGLDLRVHAGDEPGDGLVDTPAVGAVSEAPPDTVIELAQPVQARYWVVWIERLPNDGRHQARLAEAAFLAT